MSETETSTAKKIKLEPGEAPVRYLFIISNLSQISRDREHSTVIASNFPDGTKEEQVRFFFKDVQPSAHDS